MTRNYQMDDMTQAPYFPRHIHVYLLEATADTPAVLIHGPRQLASSGDRDE